MINQDHTIEISGPAINYEFKVDSVTAAQAFEGLFKLTNKDKNDTQDEISSPSSPLNLLKSVNATSPGEFITNCNAKTNPEKILAFTQYLHETGKERVDSTDIKSQFSIAKEAVPAHFSRDLSVSIRRRWVASIDGKTYYVTNTGKQLLDNKFPSTSTSARSTRKINKKTFIEAPISDEVRNIQLDDNIDGYPSFYSIEKLGDKILWILVKAENIGIEKLNQKEIEFISNKIGGHIQRKSISSVISPHIKSRRVYLPEENGVKYLKVNDEGRIYLKNLGKE